MSLQTIDTATALWRCARALAGVDADRAQERNGIGYNGTDSSFGHALAATPPEAWGPDTVRSAWLVLRKYQGQLATMGIDFSLIAQPDGGDTVERDVRSVDYQAGVFVFRFAYDPDLIGKVRQVPGRRWNAPDKRWEAPRSSAGFVAGFAQRHGFRLTAAAVAAMSGAPEAAADPEVGLVDVDDVGITIAFPFDRNLLDAVRGLPVRTWDADGRVWRCPVSAVRAVRQFAKAHRFTTSAGFDALPDVELKVAASISIRGGQFVISFPYDRDLNERVRQIPGAAWTGRLAAWTCPLDAAYEVAEFAATGTMSIADSAVEALAEAREALARIAASAASSAELDIPGLGGILRPFQKAGVAYALGALGFEQGEDGQWSRSA